MTRLVVLVKQRMVCFVHDEDEAVYVDYDAQSFSKRFGNRMREARDALDWSQRKLAEELEAFDVKLDPSAVTRIERGTREVKLREAAAIAAALDVSLENLAPPPSSSPREQFDSCIQLAADHGSSARQSLALMATQIVLALHLFEHHPELLEEFGIEGGMPAAGEAIVEAFLQTTTQKPPGLLVVGDEGQVDMLSAVIDAAVKNIVGVQGDDAKT